MFVKDEDGRDMIILPSGKKLYANHNIIGIDPNLSLTEGFDSHLYNDRGSEDYMDKRDLHFIADTMIGRWWSFKKKIERDA